MTFIIAECCVNFRNMDEADKMIKEAVEAGADAVKFQMYKPEFNKGKKILQHPWIRGIELNNIALKEEDVRYLYWRCQNHGIEFMCTPDYLEAVDILNPYVKRWKVRFGDRNNRELLRKLSETSKPRLISTDATPLPKYVNEYYLYCCPEYPPAHEPKIFAFGNTPYMLQEGGFSGYSCHIPNWKHAAFAVTHNDLKYLEVHVKRDVYDPPYCPIDNAVAITMTDLKKLVEQIRAP